MKRWVVFFSCLLLSFLHLNLFTHTFKLKNNLNRHAGINFVLPAEFSQVIALDFQGIAADIQLLQGIFFIGDKIERQAVITAEDWDYFTRIINAVIKLDPYFYDTYHFSTGVLTWGAGRFVDAVDILKYGRQFNPDDFRFPYHIGFIYFYFLDDATQGAQYLELASRIPDSPPILATLAARLAYYKGNYAFSVELLQRMLSTEHRPEIKEFYKKRLEALRGAITIEKAVRQFKDDNGFYPDNLSELCSENYLMLLPNDPYGGQYIILDNGRVYSTSKFTDSHTSE